MPTVTTTARDKVTPALHKTQGTISDTVLPAVRNGLVTAREKGGDLLASDTAKEARRRGAAVVKAAKGDPVVANPGRRWTFGLGMVALGAAVGAGALFVARRFFTTEPYQTLPTFPEGPSSNVTTSTGTAGATTGAINDEKIDLRAGAPTTTP
jgi:hypothetical protein